MNTLIQKAQCTPIFIVAVFTTAKTQKQPKGPSTDRWIKKMWYNGLLLRHKKEGNSAICSNVVRPRENYLSEIIQTEKDKTV